MVGSMTDRSPGGSGAPVINLVVVSALVVPLVMVTGNAWYALTVVPGLWLVGRIRPPVWYVLAAERRWVAVLAGWMFILAGIAVTVAVASELLGGSPWFWPVAVVSALVVGPSVWLAVTSVVSVSWLRKHLYDYYSLLDWLDRVPLGARYPEGEVDQALAIADRIRHVIDLRRPPFTTTLHSEVMARIATFYLGLAIELSLPEDEVDVEQVLS